MYTRHRTHAAAAIGFVAAVMALALGDQGMALAVEPGPNRAPVADQRIKGVKLSQLISNTSRAPIADAWWASARRKLAGLASVYQWQQQTEPIQLLVRDGASGGFQVMVRDGQHRMAIFMQRLGPNATVGDLPSGAVGIGRVSAHSSEVMGLQTTPPAYLTMAEFLARAAPGPSVPGRVAKAAVASPARIVPGTDRQQARTSAAAPATGSLQPRLADHPTVATLRGLSTRAQVRQWLAGSGFRPLGEGSVSQAWTNDSLVVTVLKDQSFQNGPQTGARAKYFTTNTLRVISALRHSHGSIDFAALIPEAVSPVPGVLVKPLCKGRKFEELSSAAQGEALEQMAQIHRASQTVVDLSDLDIDRGNFLFSDSRPTRIVSYVDPATNFIPPSISPNE